MAKDKKGRKRRGGSKTRLSQSAFIFLSQGILTFFFFLRFKYKKNMEYLNKGIAFFENL